jgi:hypothetical protein
MQRIRHVNYVLTGVDRRLECFEESVLLVK